MDRVTVNDAHGHVYVLDNATNAALRQLLYGLHLGEVEVLGVIAPNYKRYLKEWADEVFK
jgi:hypothetical protein